MRAREPTWKTAGRRLPLMVKSTSFISTSPCPEVKFVTLPPAAAKPSAALAEECSDSGSRKTMGSPQRFSKPSAAAAAYSTPMLVEGVMG